MRTWGAAVLRPYTGRSVGTGGGVWVGGHNWFGGKPFSVEPTWVTGGGEIAKLRGEELDRSPANVTKVVAD
jgi:hypothetical protein